MSKKQPAVESYQLWCLDDVTDAAGRLSDLHISLKIKRIEVILSVS